MKNRIEVFPVRSRLRVAGFRGKKWAFRFVGGNGEIIAQSEVYRDKISAKTTARTVSTEFTDAPIEVVDR